MTDISEAERLTLITREQTRLVNSEAHLLEQEDEARAFNQDRARQRRVYSPLSATILPFVPRGATRPCNVSDDETP